MLSCMSYLYVLYINLLSVISFTSIFSHSVDSVHFVGGFLFCAKVFKFNWSYLFIFCFYFLCLGDGSKNILL